MSDRAQTYVIGTAGHVDHGKSTLVKALTGIDPDRLREEKEREMTIDLGFAWLSLPSGRNVSVVDVPGHERFVKNMLAGVGGIDAALLIVAADEGPMPQTDEHLAILDLLQIERGLIVLTKIDTVDKDWRDLVAEETREKLAGTTLADAPILPVSALTGEGLDDLRSAIDTMLNSVPPHTELGQPRLPIDRVFTMSGFGTIVTGTLVGGPLQVGQDIEVQPSGRRARVRGLQSHRTKVEQAQPGSRTAVNLSGVTVEEVSRGEILVAPGALESTQLIDARLRLVPESPMILEQNDEVDFFVGSAEALARVTLLDTERITPGDEAWVQFRFAQPMATAKGDRFIIRRPSPSLTIGGGVVIDPHPRRHRRFRAEVISSLEVLASGTPEEITEQALGSTPTEFRSLLSSVTLPESDVRAALDNLIAAGSVTQLRRNGSDGPLTPTTSLVRTEALAAINNQILAMLAAYHERNPLRRGMVKEEIRSRLGLPAKAFEEIVARALEDGTFAGDAETLRLNEYQIKFNPEQRTRIDRYLAALRKTPHTPPSPADFEVSPEMAIALAETGEVVRVDEGVVFARETFEQIQQQVLEIIDQEGSITLARFRDHFGSSRKYAQAVLEYLDQRRVTRRVGDERKRYGAG